VLARTHPPPPPCSGRILGPRRPSTIARPQIYKSTGRAMQGYAMPNQIVSGIHTRLWARTFIVADASDPRCTSGAVPVDRNGCKLVASFKPCLVSSTEQLKPD